MAHPLVLAREAHRSTGNTLACEVLRAVAGTVLEEFPTAAFVYVDIEGSYDGGQKVSACSIGDADHNVICADLGREWPGSDAWAVEHALDIGLFQALWAPPVIRNHP